MEIGGMEQSLSRNIDIKAQSDSHDASVTLLNVTARHGRDKHSQPAEDVDPIYGEDAAKRYVADHFDKKNPFTFSGVSQAESTQHKDLAIFVNLSAIEGC
jgi:hypothetical protein